MNGVNLNDSIKLFGFRDGFKFWFTWCFKQPVQRFYWKWIIGKPYCTYHGWFLCNKDCKYDKIEGRLNINRWEKLRHNEIERQSKTIIGWESGICIFCGVNDGTETIDNPNGDTIERWLICKSCKDYINNHIELAFKEKLKDLEKK